MLLILRNSVCDVADGDNIKNINPECDLISGKSYIIKAMIWDGNIKPLTTAYWIQTVKE